MSIDRRSSKGEIILSDITRHHGNSEEDIEGKLIVKDDYTLIMEEYHEYYDAYKSKTRNFKKSYEISIFDIITFIKEKGKRIDDQI